MALVTMPLLASPSAPLTQASELVGMLRRHYLPEGRPPGGIFAGEIESPDGRRRADALWAPWSIAGGVGIVGHEVKVSRSDVLTELADPMKAEPWARYCSHWWLVVARARQELADRALAGEGRTSPHAVKVGRILAALDQRRYEIEEIDADAVAAALIDLGTARSATRQARQELEYLASEVRRLLDPSVLGPIARALDTLARSDATAEPQEVA